MKKKSSKPDKGGETDPDIESIERLISEYRAKEAAGLIEYAKRTYKECHSWREAWIYVFHVVHLAESYHLKSEAGKIKCVVWPGPSFDDRTVGVLKKIAGRIGPDKELIEMRLVDTHVTPAGVTQLKSILPNARVKVFTREQADEDKRIKYVNTDIEWVCKLYNKEQ